MAKFINLTDAQVRSLGDVIQQNFRGLEGNALLFFADEIVGLVNSRVSEAASGDATASGFTAMTGTGSKGALAAAPAGTAGATYTQSELQGALNRIAALEARLKAYDAVLFANGSIRS